MLLKKNAVDRGIADYRTALKLQPDKSAACQGLGDAYLSKGQWEDAISTYTKVIDRQPNPATYVKRGIAYTKSGTSEQAISYLNSAIQLDPSYADVYYNRAAVNLETGDLGNAVADLNEVLSINARTPLANIVPDVLGMLGRLKFKGAT